MTFVKKNNSPVKWNIRSFFAKNSEKATRSEASLGRISPGAAASAQWRFVMENCSRTGGSRYRGIATVSS